MVSHQLSNKYLLQDQPETQKLDFAMPLATMKFRLFHWIMPLALICQWGSFLYHLYFVPRCSSLTSIVSNCLTNSGVYNRSPHNKQTPAFILKKAVFPPPYNTSVTFFLQLFRRNEGISLRDSWFHFLSIRDWIVSRSAEVFPTKGSTVSASRNTKSI